MGSDGSLKARESFLAGRNPSRKDSLMSDDSRRLKRQTSTRINREIVCYESSTDLFQQPYQPEETFNLSELEQAKLEVQLVREELRKMREERDMMRDECDRMRTDRDRLRADRDRIREDRDKWKAVSRSILAECYDTIKQNNLQADLSFKSLKQLDAPAAAKRLEMHDEHIEHLFSKDGCDVAAVTQNIIVEIHHVKTNAEGDTLSWRFHSAMTLMQQVSKALQNTVSVRKSTASFESFMHDVVNDERLSSTLKSADVQLLTILNEIRERNHDRYLREFREKFIFEYDVVHHEHGLSFYEKSKALMVRLYPKKAVALARPSKLARIAEDTTLESQWI